MVDVLPNRSSKSHVAYQKAIGNWCVMGELHHIPTLRTCCVLGLQTLGGDCKKRSSEHALFLRAPKVNETKGFRVLQGQKVPKKVVLGPKTRIFSAWSFGDTYAIIFPCGGHPIKPR